MSKIKTVLALVAAFVCGGAWAGSPDENGIVPTYWWTFDSSNLNGSSAGANSVNWSGSSSYEDSPRLRACKGGDPYLNNGLTAEAWTNAKSFSLVGSYKIDLSNGKSKALLCGIGWVDDCFTLAADATKVYVMWNHSRVTFTGSEAKSSLESSSVVDALSLGSNDLTSGYHLYALVYDHDAQTVSVYIDGVAVLSKSGVTIPLPATGWTGSNNGKCAGILSMPGGGEDDKIGASRTSTRCDDFRIYAQALTAAQLKNMTSDFTYNPGPGNAPMGWVTGYGSGNEPFRSNTLAVAPDNALCHVVEDVTNYGRPWTAMGAKAAFTFAVRADVSAMSTSSKRVVVAVGNNSQNVYLARNNDKVVLVHTASGATIEADLPTTGFHTYVFTKDATGMAFYIDGEQTGEKNTSATGNVSTGLQFGSVYNGRPSGVDVGVGCRIANAKGWSRVLSSDEIAAVCSALPAVTGTLPVTGTIEVPTTVTTAIQSSLPLSGTGKIVTPFVWYPTGNGKNAPEFDSTWAGTLEIAAQTIPSGNKQIPLHQYGSSTDATVILKGIDRACWISGGNDTVNATVQIDGTTVIEQGSSGKAYTFKRITGAGDLTLSDWSNVNPGISYTIADLNDYTGTLTLKSTSGSKNFTVNLTNITKTDVVPGEPLVKVTTSGSHLVFNVDLTTLNGAAADLMLKTTGENPGIYTACAKVGETKYATFAEAIAASQTSSKPVVLLTTNVDPSTLTIPADQTVTIANAENLALNATADFGGTGNVVLEFHTPATYASTTDLIAYMKAAPTRVTFKFFGDSSVEPKTGFTLDFAQANATINSHVVFVGGVHTYKWKNDDRRWAASGTYESPNLLVESDTTLDFVGHDITGYNGSDMNGVLRVKNGGVLNFSKYGGGTVYFTQKIALDPGAVMNITSDMENKGFRMTGGVDKEQLYVVASEEGAAVNTATINVVGDGFAVPSNAGAGIGVFVGANSVLQIKGKIHHDNATRTIEKKGDGELVITGDVEPKFVLSAGSAKFSKMPTSVGAVNGALTIADPDLTTIDLSALTLGVDGSVDLTGCTSLTSATLFGGDGRDASEALPANLTLPDLVASVTRVYNETREEYANCSLRVANATGVDVKVRRPDGTLATTTVGDDGYAKMDDFGTEIRITNWATAFDITYENTSAFVHKDVSGASSQADTTITYNKEGTGHDVGALLKHHPYINNIGDSWFEATDALTLAVVGTMPTANRTTFIHMGNSNDGYTGLLIATGDKKDEVIIAWNNATTVTEITRMSVPNAASERHVYVVTKSDVGDKSTFTVYLDSKKWKTVTIDRITIKGGVQVGSDFGGKIHGLNPSNENYFAAVASTDDSGLVNVIRVYDRVITKAEIDEYSTAEQYPYYPPHGSSAREFTGETANWIESDEPAVAWSVTPKGGSAALANAPAEGSSLSTTLSAVNTAITVNVPADGIIYEELEVIGSGSATFVKGANSGAISISGTATLYRPITVKPGAIDFSKTPITLLEDGALAFDYSDFDVSSVFVTTKANLTGEVAQNDAITFIPPTTKPYHAVEMSYDADLKQYVMTITPNHQNGSRVILNSTAYLDGNMAGKVETEADPAVATAVFPNDTIVFKASKSHSAWVGNPVGVGLAIEDDVTLGMGEKSDVDQSPITAALDGKTITVAPEKTLTLNNTTRSWTFGSVTMNGPGAVLVKGTVTATAIAGDATLKLADGATLTVGTALSAGRVVSGVAEKVVKMTATESTTIYALETVAEAVEEIEPASESGLVISIADAQIYKDGATTATGSTTIPNETGRYTVKQGETTIAEIGVVAVTTNVTLGVGSTKPTTLVAVPFKGLDGEDMTADKLVNTALLAADDKLKIYQDGIYYLWTLNADKQWTSGTTVSAARTAEAPVAAETTVARGAAVWVTTANQIVVYGKYTTDDAPEASVGLNLMGNTTLGALTPTASEGDQVEIPGDTSGVRTFTKTDKTDTGWTGVKTVIKTTVNELGEEVPVIIAGKPVKMTVDTDEPPSVPAGRGYFLKRPAPQHQGEE